MNKNLILSLTVLGSLMGTSIIESKRCKQHAVGGAVSFPTIVGSTGSGCSTVITLAPKIVSGNDFFSSSNATISLVGTAPGCDFCPTDIRISLITFEGTFCKPFQQRPGISLGFEITPSPFFTFPFAADGTAQTACDETTAFTISIIANTIFCGDVTSTGFRFLNYTTWQACIVNPNYTLDPQLFCDVVIGTGAFITSQKNVILDFVAVGS